MRLSRIATAAAVIDPEERNTALKFLLQFVGDLHQPLHSSDDNNRGGNDRRVSVPGFEAGNLHHSWDTEFVDRLGPDARSIASDLIGHITKAQEQAWSKGTPADWAQVVSNGAERFLMGSSPNQAHGNYRLTDEYISMATQDVAVQLSKAGVQLALILNKPLGQSR